MQSPSACVADKLALLVEPRLTAYPNRWYLFADPGSMPVSEYAYLSSAQGPQMASREGWNILGFEFRCVLDVGAGVIDFRGAYLLQSGRLAELVMATAEELTTRLEDLRAARARGTSELRLSDGRTVTYRSDAEMAAAIADLEAATRRGERAAGLHHPHLRNEGSRRMKNALADEAVLTLVAPYD